MSSKSYDDGGNKVTHYERDYGNDRTGRGDTTQHGRFEGEKGSSSHEHTFYERNHSTGTTREGGHGKNFSSGGSSESSGSGK